MKIQAMKCPNCGAPLKPAKYRCEYCRSYVIVSNEKFLDLSDYEYEKESKENKEEYPGIYVFGRLLGKGEIPIVLGFANYYTGKTTTGGKMLLTNKSISFSAHAFNVGRTEAKIELSDIKKVYLGKNFWVSQQIIIDLYDSSHKFVVYHGKDWVEKINNQMHEIQKDNKDNNIGDNYIIELKKLKNLLDEGIITQEEFDIKKRIILNI